MEGISPGTSIDSDQLFGDGIPRNWKNLRTTSREIYLKTEDDQNPLQFDDQELSRQKVTFILSEASMKNKFEERLQDHLRIVMNPTTIILLLNDEVDQADAETVIRDTLAELQSEVEHRMETFEKEKFNLTLRHFDNFLGKATNIIAQIFEETNEIGFTYAGENEGVMQHHLDIVKRQPVIERTVLLKGKTDAIVEAHQALLHSLSATVDITADNIILTGFTDDVEDAKIYIFRLFRERHVQVRPFELYAREFVTRKEVYQCIEERKRSRPELEDVWWKVEQGGITVVGRTFNSTFDIIKLITNSFDRIVLPLNSIGLNGVDEFKDSLLNQFDKKVDIVLDKSDQYSVRIVFTYDIEQDVRAMISEFENTFKIRTELFRTNLRKCIYFRDFLADTIQSEAGYEEFKISCEPAIGGIEVTGTDSTINYVKQAIEKITTRKFGISEYKRGQRLMEHHPPKGDVRYMFQVTENLTLIQLTTGKIEEETVNVIVNSVAPDLELNHRAGSISSAIAKAAGRQVQDKISAILRNTRQAVPYGNVIESSAGNLRCKRIYHCVFRPYDRAIHDQCIQELRSAIDECLRRASNFGFRSISFPAICTGILGYPHTVVIETMLDVFVSYVNSDTDVMLQQLNIVVLPKDATTKKVFNQYMAGRMNSLMTTAERQYMIRFPTWTCPFYCHVTTASEEDIPEAVRELDDEMRQQTFAWKTV